MLWSYDVEALKATVPEALALVSNASIRGFYRLELRAIAYSTGMQYKSHRKVEDKSKWQACDMERRNLNKLYINCIAKQKANQCGKVVSEYAACSAIEKKIKKKKLGQMSAHPG